VYIPRREKGLLSLSEIARLVGKDPRKIKLDSLTKKGFPKTVVSGKRQYWKRSDIEKYYGVCCDE
jgi:hypothetical protein